MAAGDTVLGIALRFGVCLADIYGSNPGLVGHESDLYVGQRLTIARVKGPDHEPDECLTGRDAFGDYG